MPKIPMPVKMTSSLRVGLVAVGMVLLILALYPLNNLLKVAINSEFETIKQRILSTWHQAQLHTLPHVEQLLANRQQLQALASGELAIVERALVDYQRLEPRLQQVLWLRTQGQPPRRLLGENQMDELETLLPPQQSNIQKAFELPSGHSLLDLERNENGAAVVLVHHLRALEGQPLGVLLFVFNDANSLAQMSTLLPVNDPMSFVLIDGHGEEALNIGLDKAAIANANSARAANHGLQFSLTQGATYQQAIAPIQSTQIGVHSLPSWRLIMHLPADVIAKAYLSHVLPMALAIFVGISLLWWAMSFRVSGSVVTQEPLPMDNGEAIFPNKVYPWSFRAGEVQRFHADHLLMSLGYGAADIDISNRTFLYILASQADIEHLADLGSDILEGRSEGIDVDIRLRHHRGYWVWFNILGRIVELDKQGKPGRIEGVCIEITRRKQDQQASVNALQNIRQNYREKYQFIADSSRHMLAQVHEALAQQLPPNSTTKGHDIARSALHQLFFKINQTLAFSQLALEPEPSAEQHISMAKLMEDTLTGVDQTKILPGCKITTALDTGLAELYCFDGEKLKLLLHLLIQTVAAAGRVDRISLVVENCGRTKKHDTLSISLRASGDEDFQKALKALQVEHVSTASMTSDTININLVLAEKIAQGFGSSLETMLYPTEIAFLLRVEIAVFEDDKKSSESYLPMPPSDIIINTPSEPEPAQASVVEDIAPPAISARPASRYEAIDPDAAKVRMDGQEKILCRVYQRFLLDFQHWQGVLDKLLNEKDWIKAKVHAHTLKGASSNVDATRLSALAAQLEALLKLAKVDENDVRYLQSLVTQELDTVRREIQHYLRDHQNTDQVVVTLDSRGLLSKLDEFKQALEQGKRLKTDELLPLQKAFAGSPLAEAFDEFVNASQRFDFDKAAMLLASLRTQYSKLKGVQ